MNLPEQVLGDAEVVWEYHRLRQPPQRSDVGVVLGCHDVGVADVAAEAFRRGLTGLLVVTGATSEGTRERFPDGEAVAFARRLGELGVPAEAVRIEDRATNTGQNIGFTRALLEDEGVPVASVLIACMPYMERRAFATAKAQWPDVDVSCVSADDDLATYLKLMATRDGIAAREVVEMIVGDLHRIMIYPQRGFAIPQEVPEDVRAAFDRLVAAGFAGKLLPM